MGAGVAGLADVEDVARDPLKQLVETRCTVCHDLARVVALKRRPADWDTLVGNMINRGAPVGPDERQTIVSYLAAQFGNAAFGDSTGSSPDY